MKRKERVKEAKSTGERMGREDGKGSRGKRGDYNTVLVLLIFHENQVSLIKGRDTSSSGTVQGLPDSRIGTKGTGIEEISSVVAPRERGHGGGCKGTREA